MKKRSPYLWTPGVGPEAEALARLLAHAGKRPRETMGEAWFMGETRQMFDCLVECDLRGLDWGELIEPIDEIISGMSCFGPHREWLEWFTYLLPHVLGIAVERCDNELQQGLISALVARYPDGIGHEPYQGFRADVLDTLGRSAMDARNWTDGHGLAGSALFEGPHGSFGWGWWRVDEHIGATLCLCLKYLEQDEIDAWARSIFAISDPHWRSQMMQWFLSAELLLGVGNVQPGDSRLDGILSWRSSHCLKGNYSGSFAEPVECIPFIPAMNKAAFKTAASDVLTLNMLESWQASIEAIDYLSAEHGCTPAEVRRVIEAPC